MPSAGSCSSATTPPSPWIAMALFLVTVLASQAMQHFLRKDDCEDEEEEDEEIRQRCSVTDRFDRYAWMRRQDRLSFDHVDSAILNRSASARSVPSAQPRRPTTYVPGNKRLSVANDLDRRGNEQDNDFLPKNFNWSHFERSNDDDAYDDVTSPRARQQLPQIPAAVAIIKKESGCGDGDEESAYAQEKFVWTAPPTRSSFAQQAETANDRRQQELEKSHSSLSSKPLEDPRQSVALEEEIRRNPLNAKQQQRRRSLGASRSPRTGQTGRQSFAVTQHPRSICSDAAKKSLYRRRTVSYPKDLAPLKRIRRFFSLEGSDTDDNFSEEEEEEEDTTTEEGNDESQFRTTNREARARYNARIMPSKVVLIRHGQSMGNIDEFLYSTTPDNAMPLTKLGWEQARYTGKILKEQVLANEMNTNEPIHFIVSPYVRTVETFHGIVSAWCDPAEFSHIENRDERLTAWYEALVARGLTWHEDPRIREQDFGNYQDPETIKRAKQERHRFGVFYYRFPHGESASDVFDRVSTFLDSLWRSFDFNQSRNYVLITHGISIRVFLARYFRYTIDQFSMLVNPRNCEMVILGHDGAGKLNLEGRCDLEMKESEETHELEVVGHKFHKRLRVLPQKSIRKLKIRISYDDDN